jgi:hypothetical protein
MKPKAPKTNKRLISLLAILVLILVGVFVPVATDSRCVSDPYGKINTVRLHLIRGERISQVHGTGNVIYECPGLSTKYEQYIF